MLFSANLPTSPVVHKFSSWNKAYYHNYYKQILCFSLKYSKANYYENIAKSPYRQILSMLNVCVHRMRWWFRMIPWSTSWNSRASRDGTMAIHTRLAGRVSYTAKIVQNFVQQRIVRGRFFSFPFLSFFFVFIYYYYIYMKQNNRNNRDIPT